jgi:ABC transporter transmembrane region
MTAHAHQGAAAPLSMLDLIRHNAGKLAVTYGLFSIETLCLLSYGALIGWAIDDLMAGRKVGLMAFMLTTLLHVVTGYIRRRWDTRVFARLQAAIVLGAAARKDAEAGTLVARSAMVREVLQFAEMQVPAALHAAILGIGSLVILAVYAPLVGTLAAVSLAIGFVISIRVTRFASPMMARLNDSLDREARRLSGPATLPRRHYAHVARLRILMSDCEAAGFVSIDLMMVGVAMLALWLLTTAGGATPGSIFASFTYVITLWTFSSSMPMIAQELVKAWDVRRRIDGARPVSMLQKS